MYVGIAVLIAMLAATMVLLGSPRSAQDAMTEEGVHIPLGEMLVYLVERLSWDVPVHVESAAMTVVTATR